MKKIQNVPQNEESLSVKAQRGPGRSENFISSAFHREKKDKRLEKSDLREVIASSIRHKLATKVPASAR